MVPDRVVNDDGTFVIHSDIDMEPNTTHIGQLMNTRGEYCKQYLFIVREATKEEYLEFVKSINAPYNPKLHTGGRFYVVTTD